MVDNLPLFLYVVFFGAAVFAPLKWSLVSFILLSNIDLGSLSAGIGALNTAKAMILPVILLWRFRAFGGGKIESAAMAWMALTMYAAVLSLASLYPAYALKLLGHMAGSLVISVALVRAAKGGYLSPQIVLPVSLGTLAIALVHFRFLHDWGGEPDRCTTCAGAQALAALLTALYAVTISSSQLRLAIRLPLSLALAAAVVFNGSRIWILGLLLCTLIALVFFEVGLWVKLISAGAVLLAILSLVLLTDNIVRALAREAASNRIASAMVAAYEGDVKSQGLGTFTLRQALIERTFTRFQSGTVAQVIFGHGTCNGAQIAATLSRDPDPNRAMHNEWLRALYEWGLAGFGLWCWFLAALALYAVGGVRGPLEEYARPLFIYLPAFALGLAGENMIAGAANAVTMGLLLLIGLASISHRKVRWKLRRGSGDHFPAPAAVPVR